ncbi:MAG: hypothetical protein IPI95_16915 [Flavobacteriales bacterium]|nr:hypothetical protein [Flavobacteriales bacterium]
MGQQCQDQSYDRDSGAELSSYTTNLGSIDGVTLDCQGRIIVASWEPDQLTRYENTFTEAPVVLMMDNGLDHPADLDYDTVHDRVCVPNSGNNTVSLVDVADCTTAVPEAAPYGTFMVWPNPTNGLLQVDSGTEARGTLPCLQCEGHARGQRHAFTEWLAGHYRIGIGHLRGGRSGPAEEGRDHSPLS